MIWVVLFVAALAVLGGPLHRGLIRLAGRRPSGYRPLRHGQATARAGTILRRPPVMSERIDEDGTKHVW